MEAILFLNNSSYELQIAVVQFPSKWCFCHCKAVKTNNNNDKSIEKKNVAIYFLVNSVE